MSKFQIGDIVEWCYLVSTGSTFSTGTIGVILVPREVTSYLHLTTLFEDSPSTVTGDVPLTPNGWGNIHLRKLDEV